MAYGLQTYQEAIRREDLIDIIGDVSPDDNPLSTLFAVTAAKATTHEWAEDYLARPTTVTASVEGAQATYVDLVAPSRRNNIVQNVQVTFRVTGTERSVAIAAEGDPYDYQAAKALRDWKNRLEYSLINAAIASGSSGVARQMAGIVNIVTSHYTNLNSGSSLSETHLNSMVLGVANDVGSDDVFDLIATTLQLRQKISTFTAGNTKYIDASDKKLVRPVMIYESKIIKIGLSKLLYMLGKFKALNTHMNCVIMNVNGQFIIQLQFQGCNNSQSAGKTLLMDGRNIGWRRLVLCEQASYNNLRNIQKTCDTCGSKHSNVSRRHECSLRQNNTTYGNRTNKTLQRSTRNTQNILRTSGSRKQEIRTISTQSNSLCINKKSTSTNSLRVCKKQSRSGTKVLSQCSIYSERNRISRYGSKIKRVKNPQRLYEKHESDDIVRSATKVAVNNKMDFGVHRIFGHKDVPLSAATPGPTVLGLREDKWRVAYLRRPQRIELAKDGDRDNGMIVGEATLEYLAERSNARSTGFAQTG